jgi:hypothetical protein
MKLDHSLPAEDAGRFRTTQWSVVLLSAQGQAPGSKAALAELYRLYWFPLYAFVRRRGHSPTDTQDLVQGFFLHLLEHNAFARSMHERENSDPFCSYRSRTTFRTRQTAPVASREAVP